MGWPYLRRGGGVTLYVKVYCGVDELGAGSNEIETMAKDQGQGQQGGHPNGDLL